MRDARCGRVFGNRAAAVWIVVFDVMVNGYPVLLQRYNRALLHQRYDDLFKQAGDTAIPVLNENRLRTLIGR